MYNKRLIVSNMKIKFVILVFFIALVENGFSNDHFYFLQATPADNDQLEIKQTEAVLWKFDMENHSLMKVDSLCPWKYNNDEMIVSVNSFPNEKLISIRTRYYNDTDELSHYFFINFNEIPKITKNDYGSLFNIKDKLYWGTIGNENYKSYLMIENNKKTEKKSLNAYENILIEDISNSMLYIGELLSCKSDGTLFIVQNTDSIPLLSTKLPRNFFAGEKIYCLIKDRYHIVLKYPQNDELLCYNMQNKGWTKMNMKHPYCSLSSNNSWIFGVYHVLNNDNNVSPGVDVRDSIYNCDWFSLSKRYEFKEFPNYRAVGFGYNFDRKANSERAYYPGVLFLYNSQTGKYIEYNTNQGDSQGLLIHNDIFYFRVNDTIYSIPIIEGERLGVPKMIIKHPLIVDFHWAFS